jgi:two-component system LytT family response regulator
MESIRVVVIDDEKPARERLRRLMTRATGVELVDCCGGGTEALDIVRAAARAGSPVHVLFLDVQMPEMDGFGVMSALLSSAPACPPPDVVFVTAHDDYAIRAFDAHAVDYLLKPYTDERFHAALDRAIARVRAGHAQAVVSRLQDVLAGAVPSASRDPLLPLPPARRPFLDKILVKGAGRVRLIAVDQIRWIEADGGYVTLHTRDGASHLHRALLGTLDRSLDSRRFVRVHRSAIVNIETVEEVRQDAHGEHVLVLRDGTELRVGRRFRERLQARLGQSL